MVMSGRPTAQQQHFHLLSAERGIFQCIRYLDKTLLRKIPSLLPFLKGVLNNSNVVAESLLSHTPPFWSVKNKFPQILGGLLGGSFPSTPLKNPHEWELCNTEHEVLQHLTAASV